MWYTLPIVIMCRVDATVQLSTYAHAMEELDLSPSRMPAAGVG